MPAPGGSSALVEVIRTLDGAGIRIADIGLRRPTLDDVFLSLTGHGAEEAASAAADQKAADQKAADQQAADQKKVRS
jgi:ABC-2 type transport system ATP-binding protein